MDSPVFSEWSEPFSNFSRTKCLHGKRSLAIRPMRITNESIELCQNKCDVYESIRSGECGAARKIIRIKIYAHGAHISYIEMYWIYTYEIM